MEEKRNGCIGCVDCGYCNFDGNASCEYLRNHGRVRPVRGKPGGGCVLYAKDYSAQAELEREHRWDREKAMELRCQGLDVGEISEMLGASINALTVFFHGRDVSEPDPTAWREPMEWDRAEEYMKLYRAGVNDKGAAMAMGLSPMTISKRRRQLGLERVPRKRKRGNENVQSGAEG